jgi:membrane associated rhomboid family serine protease
MSRSDDGNKAWRPPTSSGATAGRSGPWGDAGGGQEDSADAASSVARPRTPIFNVPRPVVVVIVVLVVIHLGLDVLLSPAERFAIYQWFGFMPQRLAAPQTLPGGAWPLLWTPFTYAFLHGSWAHLGFNVVWFAIFGSPVVRRYGIRGLALIGLVGSAFGALGFAALYPVAVQSTVMIGASGAISAFTGAAMRFVFRPVRVAMDPESGQPIVLGRPLNSVSGFFRDGRALAFTVVWMGLNVALGLYGWLNGDPSGVAWQAHLAGFVAGFFLVRVFERPTDQAR